MAKKKVNKIDKADDGGLTMSQKGLMNTNPPVVKEIIEEGNVGLNNPTPKHKLEIKPKEFKINQLQYESFIKSHLEVKEKLYNLQKEFDELRIQTRFEFNSTNYKGKYKIYYDKITDRTYIAEHDSDQLFYENRKLTNRGILKLYLDDKD